MKIFLISILLFLTFSGFSQDKMKYGKEMIRVQLEDSSEVLVSKYPITNREYLIFLLWNLEVFQENPFVYWRLIPGIDESKIPQDVYYHNGVHYGNSLEIIKPYTKSFYETYFLNPNYLDYPVVGVDYYQATMFNKWLQDRYNEYLLSDRKSVQNHGQIRPYNAYHFQTETYLYGLYEMTYKSSKLKCEEFECIEQLYPLFRLPTKYEVKKEEASLLFLDKQESRKSYKVIKEYEKYFDFTITDSSYRYSIYSNKGEVLTSSIEEITNSKVTFEELTLDKYAFVETSNVNDIYIDLGYTIQYDSAYSVLYESYLDTKTNTIIDSTYWGWNEQDSVGKMEFLIIDRDDEGRVLCIENIVMPYADKRNVLGYFRFAYAIKEEK